jgi:hypothetical protein
MTQVIYWWGYSPFYLGWCFRFSFFHVCGSLGRCSFVYSLSLSYLGLRGGESGVGMFFRPCFVGWWFRPGRWDVASVLRFPGCHLRPRSPSKIDASSFRVPCWFSPLFESLLASVSCPLGPFFCLQSPLCLSELSAILRYGGEFRPC